MSNFYVYELWNPITNVPFYVGKGSINTVGQKARIYQHLHEARKMINRKRGNRHKINTILKILKEGYNIDHRVVFETDFENEAFDREKELIKKYGRRDLDTGILTNMTDGGDGVGTGYKHPTWLRELQRERMSGAKNFMYGVKHSAESKKKMSEVKKEKIRLGITIPHKHSDEHRQKMREHNAGGKVTAKPVLQLSKKHEIIKRYDSGNQAAKAMNGSKGNICNCAKTYPGNSVYGFYWIYEEDFFKK